MKFYVAFTALLFILVATSGCHASTTEAPTTEAPTTEAPTTEAPTTEAPTTEAPTTEAPTTEAPTTEAPTTEAPTTEAPTTEALTTEAPITEAPTTEAPTTEAHTTDGATEGRTTDGATAETHTEITTGSATTSEATTDSATSVEITAEPTSTHEPGTTSGATASTGDTQSTASTPDRTTLGGTDPRPTDSPSTMGPTSTGSPDQSSTTRNPSTVSSSASTITTDGPTNTQSSTRENPTTTISPPTLQPSVSYSVTNDYGRITGVTYSVQVSAFSGTAFNTKRVSRFLGIPYALPPTGSRRFKSPVKVPTGSAEVNATAHKPNCPQHGQTYDEDCLYYNVWTVQTAENANASLRYPVLVWIHGGRFETGYSSDPLRQGEELVTHTNVVVVSFNYRLGALGFLTLNRTTYTGNYGIQDQKVALEVINSAIDSFGGNRSQITLMGLDAGSASIGFHMMSSSTSALFSRAIMMGGSPMMPWSLTNDLEYVQLLSLLFISGGLNCSINEPALTQCLQSASVDRLISMQSNFTRFFRGLEFFPVVDGTTIPQDPWHAFSTGNFHSKDLLIGATNDEGANIAEDGLEALNIPIFGVNDTMLVSLIEGSIAFYPRASRTLSAAGRQFLRLHFTSYTGANDGKANFDTLGKAIGDWYLTCPVIQMAQFAEKVNRNVFLYYFTEKELLQDKWQASHGVDADYAFGVPTLDVGIIYPDANKRLSERIMENFVQFAAEGRPTSADLWKPLNNTVGNEMNYINYNADARILGNYQRGYRMTECRFWNKTLAYVNDLEQPQTTAAPPPTTSSRPPVGPTDRPVVCDAWSFNSATATTMGVLLGTQVIMAAALGFVIFKWKSLSKVGGEPIPMN